MANRKPNATKKLSGSRHVNADEPVLSGGFGPPPVLLEGVALETWHSVTAELEAVGIGSRVESMALACYCLAVEDLHEAVEIVRTDGRIILTDRGRVRNPALIIQAAAMETIRKFAGEFGLTPASRSRVKGDKKPPENPFSEI